MANIEIPINNTLRTGTANNDTIRNGSNDGYKWIRVSNVQIYADDGDDRIYNNAGDNVTIDAGAGNDYIFNSSYGDSVIVDAGAGNDTIHNSGNDVTIISGAGNDSIYNNGGLVRFSMGTGVATIKTVSIDTGAGDDYVFNEGDSVIINTGDGNDTIYILYSKLTLDSGAGDDYISICATSNNIINSGAGNDSIYCSTDARRSTIDGSAGNDYISLYSWAEYNTIYTGEGNDTITGATNTGTVIKIAAGDINNATLDGEDVVIKIGNNSTRLTGVKDKEVTLVSAQGETIKFTNSYTGVADTDTSTGGSDTQIGGSDTSTGSTNEIYITENPFTNSESNKIIYGTNGNDNIYNSGGDNVIIYGLNGNDVISNQIVPPFSGKTNGKNVTLVGGAGDDYISGFSTNHFIYALGDGNDTVSEVNNIHLVSCKFKSASLSGEDVIIEVEKGIIKLPDAKEKTITIFYGNDKTFDFKLNNSVRFFELPRFKVENKFSETIAAESHDSMYGTEIIGSDIAGTVSTYLEDGDQAYIDSTGNVTKITISDTSHKIKTPRNRGMDKDITVKDSNENVIAVVKYGEVYIYYKNEKYYIEAAAENAPVSFDVKVDNAQVIGSNVQDDIVISGKNVNVDSKLGNDKITKNNNNATVIAGKDNDTIGGSGADTTILLKYGTVRKAVLVGNDVLVTVSRSVEPSEYDHVITLQNAKNLEVTVINEDKDKIKFTNTYDGDYKLWEKAIEDIFNASDNDYQNLIYQDILATDTPSINYDTNKLSDFMKQLKVVSNIDGFTGQISKVKDIPAEILASIAGKIGEKLEGSKSGTIAPNIKSLMEHALSMISSVGTSTFVVPLADNTYNFTFSNFISGGTGSAEIKITKNGKNYAALLWTDDKKHKGKAISDYLKSLEKLNEKVWWNVITGLAKDAGISDRATRYMTYAKDIIQALITEKNSTDTSVLGLTIIKAILNTFEGSIVKGNILDDLPLVKNFIKDNLPHGKQIIKAVDYYKNIKKAQINSPAYVNVSELDKTYKDLQTDYIALESALTGNPAGILFNWFSDFVNGNIKSAAVAEAVSTNSKIYVSENSEIVTSTAKAAASIEMVNKSQIVYTALNSNNQEFSFGTSEDTLDVVINTSNGNDNITSFSGANVTVNSGAGNDTISLTGVTASQTETEMLRSDVLLLANAENTNVLVNSGAGDDSIVNYNKNAVVDCSAGKDSVTNNSSGVSVYAGSDDDYIYNRGDNVFIDGDTGSDYIKNYGDGVSIYASAGDDYIENYGDNVNIWHVGKGNDTLVNFSEKINMPISGYTTIVSTNDIILKTNEGSITLKDANITAFNISGSVIGGLKNSNDTIPVGISIKNSIVTASKTFTGKKIDLADYDATKVNAAALSQGVSIVGSAANNSIKGGSGSDTIYGDAGKNTLTSGKGADIFVYAGGNDFISDYAVAQDKIKLQSFTSSTVKGSDVILTTANGNLTVKGAKDKVVTFIDDSGETSEKIFYKDTSYAPLETGLTYDAKRILLTASNKFTGIEINLENYLSAVEKVNASAVKNAVSITGNSNANSLKGGKGADTISGGKGNDTVSLGGGTDIYIYSSGNDLIQDYKSGEDKIKLTTGNIISSSLKGSDIILKTSSGSITVKKAKDKKITVIDGNGNTSTEIYGKFNYSNDKSAITLASTFTGSLKSDDYATTVKIINGAGVSKTVNIFGNSQNNTILGGNSAETIYGGAGNDSVLGNAGNDKLYGDAGADSLNGGKGNDTLTGGAGNDVFFYASGEGNDVIADFTAGQDTITLTSGTVAAASLKSSDMVFKIGSGTLTVKNGKNQEIAIGNSVYYNDLIYNSGKTEATLGASFSGSLKSSDYATTVKTINASGVTKSTNIIGNAQDNTIIGSSKAETMYGGSGNDSINGNAGNDKIYGDVGNDKLLGGDGNDTLNGGAGNDTLTGGTGKDVFSYEGGSNVITDYTAGQDTIKLISGTITRTSYSGNNVIFTVGSGAITVQNGKGKKITITDSKNKTTTQTYSQDVSYTNARWFDADDNNFITDGMQIEDISDKNYEFTPIESLPPTNALTISDSLVSAVTFEKK